MAELTLREPLNAAEIVEILLQEIERRLTADSTLTPDITYSGFHAKFEIKLKLQRPNPVETLVWGEAGKTIFPENGPISETAIAVDYTTGAPNVERQNHNLPIPVMVQTPTGMERRKVKIERAGKGK